MKAILFDTPGAPDVLQYGDAPDPTPGPDELLVRVRATAVNRADLLQRRGVYAPPPGASPILGLELAGEVVTPTGQWRAGDRVMAVVTGGGYAELAVVPAGMAMRIPENLSFEEAAAIPEAFLTAFLNMFTLSALQAGETVLIHAGASGVGTAAIQLARVAGARVFATAGSAEKLALCRELGAELVINYREESFAMRVLEATGGRGVDLILDFVGAPYWQQNTAALALDGRLQLIGFLGGSTGQIDLGPIMTKRLRVTGATLRRTPLSQKIALTADFVAFAHDRLARGELRPIIDTIYPLRNAAEAHRVMEANRNAGKLVLRVDTGAA
ncbi:MAG: NADPH:quinone oxidoreductase [Roseiflexus castenholzii]|uniref:NAD(P)H-quinone oxidoreductase n=1 Tax=Roseiflexus castenholzii TaxID=120962 RepID=UPI000CB9D539|nr:MAG: NADPH:quinone oxidoreductase [Roseiflexus castenholzii]